MVLICHSLNWWGMGFTWREKFSWCLIGFQMYVLECLSHFKSCSYIVPIHMPRCVCIKSRTLWNEIGCPYLLENWYSHAIEKAKIDSNYRLRSHEGTPCLFLLLFIFFKEQRVLNIFIFMSNIFFYSGNWTKTSQISTPKWEESSDGFIHGFFSLNISSEYLLLTPARWKQT